MPHPARPIHVVGLAGAAPGTPAGAAALADAALVAAGREQLRALHARHAAAGTTPPDTVTLASPLDAALTRIAAHDGPVAVLASGDPGFFGVLRTLALRVDAERLVVHPAPSSVSRAFARVGLPWEDARVVSAHGRGTGGITAALGALLAGPKVAVLTAPDADPAFLACAYARIPDAPPRTLAVCERLGEPDERVVVGTPAEIGGATFADPNVLLAWRPDRPVPPGRVAMLPPRGADAWGLPEEAFAHRAGMITKREVRAAALAALGPGPGDVVWDVGCGSGSVAVECARLGAGAIALDHDAEAVAFARENAAAHGVEIAAFAGAAPAALEGLPDPDAAFVGGGGADLDAIVDACAARARRVVVVTLATLERIGPTLARLQAAGLDAEGTLLQASRIRPLADQHRLAPTNPVAVLVGRRPGA
ncbi:precorrin-6y C5,15-methyltransferase (decarboxylating) subunit CbiE [Patulibacter sp. SYSU D01012]|uniref:precorrin-6y C5,15-methyltransferase (decarboxylating) subunit CbiE n=1 Tax=Patulibacter sp. SYSU D01012 TaxID=2817381 RepID=UPI001B30E1D2